MSVLEWRGGFPVVFTGTVADTGVVTDSRTNVYSAGEPIRLGAHQIQLEEDGRKGPITSKWVRIVNHGATAFKVYFSQDHYDADVHYVTVPAPAAGSIPIWEGPAELQGLWLKAVSGTPTFEITAFHRRG